MTTPPTASVPVSLDQHGLPPGYPFRPEWEIAPRQLADGLQSAVPPLLIDCRTPGEWERVRLPQARLIPLQQWTCHLEELEEHKNRPIVIYCHHGGRSLQMALLLRRQGFAEVRSLAGGIDLWAMAIDPGMARY